MPLTYEKRNEGVSAEWKKSVHVPPHLHEAIEIIYVTDGTVELGVGQELFHMERDVLNIGDSVTIIEGQLPFSYYYTIVPALAMSKNYKNAERIKSREGKVVSKERKGSTFEIYVEFEN